MGVKSIIVGITTRADGKDKEEFLASGSNHCFEKPLDQAKVEQVLQEHENFGIWFIFYLFLWQTNIDYRQDHIDIGLCVV